MVSIMEYGMVQQQHHQQITQQQQMISQVHHQQQMISQMHSIDPKPPKSAVSQRSIDLQLSPKSTAAAAAAATAAGNELAKRALKLDLVNATKQLEEFAIKSPRSPLTNSVRTGRLPHQSSLTAQVDIVEDRKTLRDALYQGIFHRHRRTIFAVGSFLRMLRSRNSQYNTIRSSSEGEDIDEATR